MSRADPNVSLAKRAGALVLGLLGVGLLMVMVFVGSGVRLRMNQSVERVEADHGFQLTNSADDIQAMGDLVRFVDHGRSAVFVIDTDELALFIERIDEIDDVDFETFVPGNSQYQPDETPWPSGQLPTQTFDKASPAGGDFMHVAIYPIDDRSTGIWLYSDWN